MDQRLIEAERLSAEVVRLFQQGKFEEAMPLAKSALKIREGVLGPNDPGVAHALDNLARLYLAQKKNDEAESLFKRCLAIYEKNPGVDERTVGRTLDLLAGLSYKSWDFGKAEELYLRAIAFKEKAFGPNDQQLLYSLEALADLYAYRFEYKKGAANLRRVVSLKEKLLGENNTEVGKSLEKLSCAVYKEQKSNEAGQIEARANHILYSEAARKSESARLEPEILECKLVARLSVGVSLSSLINKGVTEPRVAIQADEDGKITSARMISGSPSLKEETEKAVLKARLRPTLVDGRAVPVQGELLFRFSPDPGLGGTMLAGAP